MGNVGGNLPPKDFDFYPPPRTDAGMGAICSTKKPRSTPSVQIFKFIAAAAEGNVEQLEKISDTGLDVNVRDWSGRSALHLASAEGHADAVKVLLSRGADVNAKDKTGRVPLLEAQFYGHKEVIELLVGAGGISTSVDAPSSSGTNPDKNQFVMEARISETFSQSFEGECDLEVKDFWVLNNTRNFAIMEAFPKSIAVAMIHGQKIAPIKKEIVSLLFSDIVGFTTLSSKLSSVKVSRILVRLFARFDQIAHIHGVQKVDMIGDAYIAATNLLEDQPDDHAARLAHFASDITAAASEMPVDEDDPDGPLGYVRLRVGLHCGPVSAQVVTAGAMRYTLFGDTVQIAATMESSGSPGRIQCSDRFARLVSQQADDFLVVPRESRTRLRQAGDAVVHGHWIASLRRSRLREGSFLMHSVGDLHCKRGPSSLARSHSAGCLGSLAAAAAMEATTNKEQWRQDAPTFRSILPSRPAMTTA